MITFDEFIEHPLVRTVVTGDEDVAVSIVADSSDGSSGASRDGRDLPQHVAVRVPEPDIRILNIYISHLCTRILKKY